MNKNIKPYIYVLPTVAVLVFVLGIGIFEALLQSLGYFKIAGLNEFTLKYFIDLFNSTAFIKSVLFTLHISFFSSITAIIIAVILLKFVRNNKTVEFICKVPVIVPHIIVALFCITLFSDSGIVARIMYSFGINERYYNNILFTSSGLGIILSYIWKETPYILLSLMAITKRLNGKYEETAVNLGASNFYTFIKVTLPMLLPTIFTTFIITFSFSFGAYEIPMLLGPTTPRTLPVKAFIEYQSPILANRPYAMAINVVIIVVCIISIIIFKSIVNRILRMNVKYE